MSLNLIDVAGDWHALPASITAGVDHEFLDRMAAKSEVSWRFSNGNHSVVDGRVFTHMGPTHVLSVSLASRPGNSFEVIDSCSCRSSTAHRACDHVKYLVARFHDDIADSRKTPKLASKLNGSTRSSAAADAWLAEIAGIEEPKLPGLAIPSAKDAYTHRALLLSIDARKKTISSITPLLTRPKKRGQGIVSKILDLSNLHCELPEGGRSEEEVRALSSLLEIKRQRDQRIQAQTSHYSQRYGYSPHHIAAEVEFTAFEIRALEAALKVLSQNHQLYIDTLAGTPAPPGGPREAGTDWTMNADGATWSMRFVAGPDALPFKLFSLGSLGFYLAGETSGSPVYGELKGDLGLLRTSPPTHIQPRLIPAILGQLRKRGLERTFGLENFRLPRPLEVPAVPCATYGALLNISIREYPRHHAGFLRLNFKYGDHFLEQGTTSVVVPAANPEEDDIEIIRDVAGEAKAIELLKSLGADNGFAANSPLSTNTTAIEPAEAKKLYVQHQGTRFSSPQSFYVSTVSALGHAGFEIILSDGLDVRLIEDPDFSAVLEPEGDAGWWFDVSLGVMIDGKRMDAMAIVTALLKNPAFMMDRPLEEQERLMLFVPFGEATVVKLSVGKVRAVIAPVLELLQHAIARGERLRVPRLLAGVIAGEAEMRGTRWDAPESLRETLRKMTQVLETREIPIRFKATLRPYQVKGFHWLAWLSETGLGGILADDMGLGKTIQVLAHVLSEWELMRHKGLPVLVIANVTLLDNWERETREKAPILRPLRYYGGIAERRKLAKTFMDHDIVITTYETLVADSEVFMNTKWSLLVADEAHKMKNPSTNWFKTIREIPAARRLCVTGTPVENRLLDLWSLMDVAEPGLLGNRAQFKEQFITPIEKGDDSYRMQSLKKRIAPLILRRLKEEVAKDLPPLQEKTIMVELSDSQRTLYESIRVLQHTKVKEIIEEFGLDRARTHILTSLLKMRQVCLSPRLVDLEAAKGLTESSKIEELMRLLRTLKEEGRKTLVFSSFSNMLDIVGEHLYAESIRYCKVTGSTKNRQGVVDMFQNDPKIPVFLLTLKAGGVGLNITAADTVIILDPWWNPAAEDQAGDRAHRIGQDKPVTMIRLICTNTIEQKVEKLKSRKRALVDALFGDGVGSEPMFTMEDIDELFGPSGNLALPDRKPKAIGHKPDPKAIDHKPDSE